MTGWDKLNNDPRFAELSYDEQIRLRAQFLTQELPKDPRFAQMSEQERGKLYSDLVYSAPKTGSDRQKEYEQLLGGIRAGDPEAQKAGLNWLGKSALRDQMSILDLLSRATRYFTPEEEGEGDRDPFGYQNSVRDKELAGLRYALSQDEATAKKAQMRNTLSTIGGVLLDTAAYYGLTAPLAPAITGLTKGGKVAKLLARGVKVADMPTDLARIAAQPGIVRFAKVSLVPNVLDGIRGGFIEVARQNILENIEPYVQNDAKLWTSLKRNAEIFGEDFLYGMAGFMGLSLIAKTAKMGLGTVQGLSTAAWRKKFTELSGGIDAEDFLHRMTAGGFTPDQLKNMKGEAVDLARMAMRKKEVIENVAKMNKSELMETFAMLQGIDFHPSKVAGKFDVVDPKDMNMSRYGLGEDEAYAYVGDILRKREKVTSAEGRIDTAFSENNLAVHRTLRTPASNVVPSMEDLARMTAPDLGGRINRSNAVFVVKELGRKAGIDDDTLNSIKFIDKGRTVSLGNADTITLPKTIKTPRQEELYVNNLVKGVKKVLQKKNIDPEKLTLFDEFTKIIDNERLLGPLTPQWVKFKAAELQYNVTVKPNGKIDLYDTVTGETIPFEGYIEAGEFLFRRIKETKPKQFNQQIIAHAQANFDDGITMLDDGKVVVKSRGIQKSRVKTEYASMDELLQYHPEYIPQLPVSEMPKWNIVDNTPGHEIIEIQNGTAVGSSAAMRTWTSQFKDYEKISKSKLLKTNRNAVVMKDKVTPTYTVHDKDWNITLPMNSSGEVRDWFARNWDEYFNLEDLGAMKGARVQPVHGKYFVYQQKGSNPRVANNKEELTEILKDLPDAPYTGRELSEYTKVSEDIGRHLELEGLGFEKKPIGDYNEATMKMIENGYSEGFFRQKRRPNNAIKDRMMTLFAPPDITLKRFGLQAKDPKYYENIRLARRANQVFEGKYNQFSGDFEKNIVGGMSKSDDMKLNAVMFGKDKADSYADAWKNMHGSDIPADMVERIERTRRMFESYKTLFGVDGWKFLEDYYPRIRTIQNHLPDKLSGNAVDYISKEFFNGNTPPEIKVFFNNLRIGDVVTGTYMSSYSDVVRHYVRQGLRYNTVREPVEEIFSYLKSAKKTLSTESHAAMSHYANGLVGFFDEPDITALNNAIYQTSKKYFKDLHKHKVISHMLSEKDLQNVLGFLNSVTISATMAYRPWPVIRNLFQPMNTLGLVVSQDVVMKAMKKAIDDPAKRLARLRNMGIASQHNLLLNYTSDTTFRKFTQKGLHMYQSADHWNRAITDAAAETLIEDAWSLYSKTGDFDQFIKNSKLSRIDQQDRLFVTKKLENGDIEGAINEFSEILNHRTQFPYKSWENPQAFRGVLGKLFGAYQHYPVYYTANMVENLRLGSWAEKIESMLSTAVTGAVAYTTFNRFLNIDAKDFLFYTPISLTGGPIWQVANDFLALTDSGYESDVAWEQLKRNIPALFTPGYGMSKSVIEGIQALGEGDVQTFFLKALSAPIGDNF